VAGPAAATARNQLQTMPRGAQTRTGTSLRSASQDHSVGGASHGKGQGQEASDSPWAQQRRIRDRASDTSSASDSPWPHHRHAQPCPPPQGGPLPSPCQAPSPLPSAHLSPPDAVPTAPLVYHTLLVMRPRVMGPRGMTPRRAPGQPLWVLQSAASTGSRSPPCRAETTVLRLLGVWVLALALARRVARGLGRCRRASSCPQRRESSSGKWRRRGGMPTPGGKEGGGQRHTRGSSAHRERRGGAQGPERGLGSNRGGPTTALGFTASAPPGQSTGQTLGPTMTATSPLRYAAGFLCCK